MNNTSSVCWPEHLGEHSCCESLCQNADPAVLIGLHRHLWLGWCQGGNLFLCWLECLILPKLNSCCYNTLYIFDGSQEMMVLCLQTVVFA